MTQLSGLLVPIPGGKALALTGLGAQWAIPGGAFTSEVSVYRYTFVLNTTAVYFSWVT